MTEQEIVARRNKLFYDIVGCAQRSYNYFHWGVDELVYEAGLKGGMNISHPKAYISRTGCLGQLFRIDA